jgi:hypothetical protein
MTEILTESFCERCGTRYTFETVQRRGRPLGRLTTLGRGLKHFVVMPDASLDEAMAVARSEVEQQTTSAQLEAFHRTFNFCLSCRQYTCGECWNPIEGRCLSCAPLPVEEAAPPAEAILDVTVPLVIPIVPATAPAPGPAAGLQATLEPGLEAAADAAAIQAAEAEAEAEAEVEAAEEEVAEDAAPEITVPEAEPLEPGDAALPAPEADRSVAGVSGVEPREGAPHTSASSRFEPGRSLDDEIAAYELRIAALAEAPIESEPPLRPAAVRESERGPTVAAMSRERSRPEQAPAVAQIQAEAVTVAAGAGSCRACGLSISASARFCRRCGARQDA